MKKTVEKKIPFSFVIENLFAVNPVVKPMFGCHAIYVEEKIMLILRHRDDHESSNGIWIATSAEHHSSLKNEFSNLSSIEVLSSGKGETEWQMLHIDDEHFEEKANKLTDLILNHDVRIGRVPKSKKKKSKQ